MTYLYIILLELGILLVCNMFCVLSILKWLKKTYKEINENYGTNKD